VRPTAPHLDGTVTNLAAWTVGGVVKPGDTILNVEPHPVIRHNDAARPLELKEPGR